jgi:F0F1-type ATP synthase membrane subunit b/b'
MPQFDFFSFSGQVFWTLAGFYAFYFLGLHLYLSKFSEMFKMRQKLITTYIKDNKTSSSIINTFNTFLSIS